MHEYHLNQESCQITDSITQQTIDERLTPVLDQPSVPKHLYHDDQQLAHDDCRWAIAHAESIEIQWHIRQHIDNHRTIKHLPAPFAQEQQHCEFYRNRRHQWHQ